jgi:uncharacterized lipoprotein
MAFTLTLAERAAREAAQQRSPKGHHWRRFPAVVLRCGMRVVRVVRVAGVRVVRVAPIAQPWEGPAVGGPRDERVQLARRLARHTLALRPLAHEWPLRR